MFQRFGCFSQIPQGVLLALLAAIRTHLGQIYPLGDFEKYLNFWAIFGPKHISTLRHFGLQKYLKISQEYPWVLLPKSSSFRPLVGSQFIKDWQRFVKVWLMCGISLTISKELLLQAMPKPYCLVDHVDRFIFSHIFFPTREHVLFHDSYHTPGGSTRGVGCTPECPWFIIAFPSILP